MRSIHAGYVALRATDTIKNEIEEVYRLITRRAHQLFTGRGEQTTLAVDEWLAAERALIRKPEVRLMHDHETFTVSFDVSNLELTDAEILITATELLFRAKTVQEPSRIFRAIPLPREIVVRSVNAWFLQGKVILNGRFASTV